MVTDWLLAQQPVNNGVSEQKQVIVPRKAVLEIIRLLEDDDAVITLCLGQQPYSYF